MQYKVKSLSIAGRGKRIIRNGETISHTALMGGDDAEMIAAAEKLVRQGHLIALDEEGKEIKVEAKPATPPVFTPTPPVTFDRQGAIDQLIALGEEVEEGSTDEELKTLLEEIAKGTENDPLFKQMTRKKLMADLTEAGVEFNPGDSKGNLFALWSNLQKQKKSNEQSSTQ